MNDAPACPADSQRIECSAVGDSRATARRPEPARNSKPSAFAIMLTHETHPGGAHHLLRKILWLDALSESPRSRAPAR
ncbi:MAG: hypothetical protein H6825_16535 [Planctomycetes bacterium]|nr:hypothetical protein [Planctomycetota bacterium]